MCVMSLRKDTCHGLSVVFCSPFLWPKLLDNAQTFYTEKCSEMLCTTSRFDGFCFKTYVLRGSQSDESCFKGGCKGRSATIAHLR